MLAASWECSNVPPDHLQAAPFLALTGIAPHEFNKIVTIGGPQAQPGVVPQYNAAGLQGNRQPFLIVIKDRDLPV